MASDAAIAADSSVIFRSALAEGYGHATIAPLLSLQNEGQERNEKKQL
jgi:hypothetical protein